MNGKVILRIVITLVLFTAGVWFFIKYYLGQFEKDIELTRGLTGQMHEIVRDVAADHETYDTSLELWNPQDFTKAVFVEYFPYFEEGDRLTYRYISRMNELLGTDANLGEPQLSGFIAGRTVPFVMGNYTDGSFATRLDYEVWFVKLPEKVIVRHIMVEGSTPPRKKKSGESGVGKKPSKKEIARRIKAELES